MDILLILPPFLIALVSIFYIHFTNQKATRLKKLQNEFTAMMIHELRSPLSVIRSSADMILKEKDRLGEEKVSLMIKQIEDSSSNLLSIVNDLLDVAKIEASKIELFKHPVNLNELLESVMEGYSLLAKEKGLTAVVELDPTISYVSCDPEQLKHVLSNLLSNAVKYTAKGHICLRSKQSHGFVQIEVCDTGVGITPKMRQQIFKKFVQARELPVSREHGTGLGLVIAKGIVEAHGGKIWVEDNLPSGSKFIFTIPLS
ncbi:HAMP domain-containing histidine kinase [Candidatus Nomurabacteria bacterium]|uniref:histidine kinase n=1 Tax=candidate division WWE3 bacterium TaxID=2053526 RepID=A0A955IVZ4_UNCKA|nr:HAMP domain-containing histidine kinase [candidate division WWE3 bacterium]MCB9824113.1 HAMP domain-containing histidine kinase [Candidatus Nomurabacteria bacterium]MCB9826916.1 HAMP domain-containing histidine kinase [Candidatus Nomurabacteria bacterium]MCB9828054.1 HAMP domain-containing histidine kinase [Candidatus Nomurabacteria bacterium]HXK52713.1 HAMP domain-containing sensor histidine kinase [bacterium]